MSFLLRSVKWVEEISLIFVTGPAGAGKNKNRTVAIELPPFSAVWQVLTAKKSHTAKKTASDRRKK
jgi:hypothetical protein